MQVGDINVNNDIKNRENNTRETYDTMSPLNWLLKIFALNSFKNEKSKKEVCCSITKKIITATIFAFINIFTLQYKVRYIYGDINLSIKLMETIQTVYDYFQYIVDLYFVSKYGREVSLEYYHQYGNIDKILDITYYSDIKSRLVKLVGIFIFIWLASSICDFSAWYMSFGWVTPLFYSQAYVFLLIKILTTIDLTSQVIHVEYRLRIMGNIAQDFYNSADDLPETVALKGLISDSICNKNWFYTDEYPRVTTSRFGPKRLQLLKNLERNCSNHHASKWLSRCYLLLTEQCTFINHMYGIRILLNSLSLLIDMVRFTNIAIRIIIGSQHTTYNSGYFPAVSSLVRMLTCAAVLTSMVRHCELAYRECERIIRIVDHLLINKNPCDELRAAATELRGLVSSRPISFNMANFFRLDYSFLMSTASVVVTYTIILLQSMN